MRQDFYKDLPAPAREKIDMRWSNFDDNNRCVFVARYFYSNVGFDETRFNAEIALRFVGRKYKKYIDGLIEDGILIMVSSYNPIAHKSNAYKITEAYHPKNYKREDWTREVIKITDRFEHRHLKSFYYKWCDHCDATAKKAYDRSTKNLTNKQEYLNVKREYKRFCDDNFDSSIFDCYRNSDHAFQETFFFKKGGQRKDRIYHTLNGLKRNIKTQIRQENNLANVDIKKEWITILYYWYLVKTKKPIKKMFNIPSNKKLKKGLCELPNNKGILSYDARYANTWLRSQDFGFFCYIQSIRRNTQDPIWKKLVAMEHDIFRVGVYKHFVGRDIFWFSEHDGFSIDRNHLKEALNYLEAAIKKHCPILEYVVDKE